MKPYVKVGFGALVLGLLSLPATGRAQEHRDLDLQTMPSPLEAIRGIQNAGRALFVMTDVNHDGQISQQEAVDAGNLLVGGFFFRADADGNGVVTDQEARASIDKNLNQNPWMRYVVQTLAWQARQKGGQSDAAQPNRTNANAEPGAALLGLIDTNNDRQIQATELRQLVQTLTQGLYAAADTNRDGEMSPAEVNAAVAGAARAMAQQAFQQADTDRNGQLSREEYDKAIVEPANVVFQILDLNHDGQISQQEAQQTRRVLLSQLRALRLPEPPNSPTNLIEQGRLPREAAPVPNFNNPGQNRPQAAPPR